MYEYTDNGTNLFLISRNISSLCSHCSLRIAVYLFNSSEIKTQVSFSDHLLSVVCPCTCLKIFTFLISSEPLGQIQPNFDQIILGLFAFKFLRMKSHTLFKWKIKATNKHVRCRFSKLFFSRTTGLISAKLASTYLLLLTTYY